MPTWLLQVVPKDGIDRNLTVRISTFPSPAPQARQAAAIPTSGAAGLRNKETP